MFGEKKRCNSACFGNGEGCNALLDKLKKHKPALSGASGDNIRFFEQEVKADRG
jgi:hypothetical protein